MEIMYKSIQFYGLHFNKDEINLLCEEKINDSNVDLWEREIFVFLRDWFSESDSISVTTSGSTGVPQTIKLLKRHIIVSAKSTLNFFKLKEGDNALLCLPTSYIAGKMMIVRAVVGKLNLIYTNPTSFANSNFDKVVDFAAMVPNQVFTLLNSLNGRLVLENIKQLLIGGASISNELEGRLLEFPGINAWHSYAMTETITHIALRKVGDNQYLGDFYPLTGVVIALDSNDHLVIDYPGIGVNNCSTNDIAQIYNDGSFSILGRSDNIVISGGIKLNPELIEPKIRKYVNAELFIGGIPDKKFGEKLVLFIEGPNLGYNIIDLVEICKDDLNSYEMPKEINYLSEFLRTESGKIRRKANVDTYLDKKSPCS